MISARNTGLVAILALWLGCGVALAQRGGRGGMVGQRPGGGGGGGGGANFGNRAAFGGLNGGNRPTNIVGSPQRFGNRNTQIGDSLGVGNRANFGNVGNRTQVGNNFTGNRTQINNNVVNRPTNINNVNTNINRNNFTNIRSNNITNINNVTNVNRPGYGGGYRGGYGGYGWGGYGAGYRPGYGGANYNWGYRPGYGWGGYAYRPNPYFGYHQGWVNGYWNGNYSSWGYGNIGNSALGWGLGIGAAAWGLGSLFNNWGYSSFTNPYYASSALVVQQPALVATQPVAYDYSRPLDVSAPLPSQGVLEQASASFDTARAAFKAGDYVQALQQADQVLKQTPNDPIVHEFRAFCLLALGRYDEAAVPLYNVLSVGPGWDWTTLIGLYPSIDVYTAQLRALEAYCDATPRAASARFVLAALYMTQGNNDYAIGRLRQVVALQPRDRLSAQLLETLTAKPQAAPASGAASALADNVPPNPTPAQTAGEANAPEGPPFPKDPVPDKFTGSWSASPAKDTTITLTLDDDNKGFTWKVLDRGQPRSFRGQATFDDDTLALSPPDQPPMVGKVAWKDDSHFVFKALGGPPNDPGLNFGK